MEQPEHKIFQVRNKANDNKNNHIYVPFKPKAKHDVGMIEGLGF